jgi:hypothetical protein
VRVDGQKLTLEDAISSHACLQSIQQWAVELMVRARGWLFHLEPIDNKEVLSNVSNEMQKAKKERSLCWLKAPHV